METKYYSCPERADLDKVITFDGNYYEDSDIVIDVIGKVNLNPPIELEEGEVDTREPVWSDYLFNVCFKTGDKADLFGSFKEERPKTPFRRFL